MQKSKTIKQYFGKSFSISVRINNNGKIITRSMLNLYKEYIKPPNKNTKHKRFNLFSINEDNLYTTIFCTIASDGKIQNAGKIFQKDSNELRKKSNEYYQNHKKEHSECAKKWRENNQEKILELRKNYYEENKVIIALKSKTWKEENKEKLEETNKLYKINNLNKIKENDKKQGARRRGWGYNPINEPFEDCHFHHTHIDKNHNDGIHIPAELHNSVWHSYKDQKTMDKINKAVFEWYEENQ